MASEGSLVIQEPASIPLPHSRHASTVSTTSHACSRPASRHNSIRPSTPRLSALAPSCPSPTPSTSSQDPRAIALPQSTDSMVTIRLSKPTSISTTDDIESSSIESNSTVTDINKNIRRKSSLDIMHGIDLDTEINVSSCVTYEEESVQEESPHEEVIFQGRPASDVSLSRSQTSMSQEHDESRPSSGASSDASSDSDPPVDWQELDKEEQSEEKENNSDESTAFLLARLEQENNALAIDPRFNAIKSSTRTQSRPPSMQVLKKMVRNPSQSSARFSLLPTPPPMTELEFWAALVKDYPQTAQRLPTLTSNKIKGGVPPPLRGVVWMSMVGAREVTLGDQFDQLAFETSPYEVMIAKDIGRSFPGVEMFKEAGGEGQTALMKVLKCFSLYDKEIGYCQGLGFLVGPLLMQMPDKDAFCVLVKLMEKYDLRSCYMPDLAGLHLRIFQFQRLLTTHLPDLATHLASLQVEAAYLSQWFLSFFAVTCPLPMLFRIYDVILAEGASETIMRVSLSLMRRNQEKLMQHTEFEEVMQLLLGRALWEPYNCNADDLVTDFMEMTGVVTPESLQKLDQEFKDAKQAADPVARAAFSFPDVSAAATRFMGRLWTATPTKPNTLSPGTVNGDSTSRPGSFLRRTPSKQSIATINSSTDIGSEGTGSVSTVTTEATILTSRDSSAELSVGHHSKSGSVLAASHRALSKEDRGLHGQIEDLLMAISDMQREQSIMSTQLQKEREERDEDHHLFRELVDQIQAEGANAPKSDRRQTFHSPDDVASSTTELSEQLASIVERVEGRLATHKDLRRSSMMETKQRLRDSLIRHKDQLVLETSRTEALNRQLDEQEKEMGSLREQLREARERLRDGVTEREKMQRTLNNMRNRQSVAWPEVNSPELRQSSGTDSIRLSISSNSSVSPTTNGLRELTLGRTPMGHANKSSVPPRGASLATQKILSTKDHAPATEDALVVELAHAKTAEAAARTELEEVKGKMDALRKMLGVPSPTDSLSIPSHRPTVSEATIVPSDERRTPKKQTSQSDKSTSPASAGALGSGWWWSRRSASTAGAPTPAATVEKVENS